MAIILLCGCSDRESYSSKINRYNEKLIEKIEIDSLKKAEVFSKEKNMYVPLNYNNQEKNLSNENFIIFNQAGLSFPSRQNKSSDIIASSNDIASFFK